MSDRLLISEHYRPEYIVDNKEKNIKIEIEHYNIYKKFQLTNTDNVIYIDFLQSNPFENEILKQIIKDLKNKEVHNYDDLIKIKVKVIANSKNIAKLKSNLKEYQKEITANNDIIESYENQIMNLNDKIESLYSQIQDKEAIEEELRLKIEELEEKINKYKELIQEID